MSQSKFKVGSLLGSTALVALGVAFAGQATAADHARVIKSSKDQVSLKISGQFSREITVVDDGFSTRVRHADSTTVRAVSAYMQAARSTPTSR